MIRFIKALFLALTLVLLIAVLVLFGWFWRASEPIPEADPPVQSKAFLPEYQFSIDPLRGILRDSQERYGLPSLSAAIGINGELVWAGAVGYRDVANGIPADVETVYRIGSVSKSLTAALLMKLQQQGRLDIDAPLGKYTGEVPPWTQVTLRQLVTHQGGVRHYREGFGMLVENLHNTYYPTTEGALAMIDQTKPLFEPGSNFNYSTYGYTLLAYGMEHATDSDFAALLDDELVAPLGLDDTTLDGKHGPAPNIAIPYLELGGDNYRAPETDLSYKYAGGGIVSTPSDLVKFANALLTGDYLESAEIDQLWHVAPLDNGQLNADSYAMGFRVHESALGPRVSHGGMGVGGLSYLAIYPERGIVVAFAANTVPSEGSLDREALAEKLANAVR